MKQQTLHIFNNKSKSIEKVNVFYSDKYLKCGDENCAVCNTGQGHGPYWNATFTLNGQVKKVFLGKKFSPQKVETEIRKLMDLVSSFRRPDVEENHVKPHIVKPEPKPKTNTNTDNKHNLIDRIDVSKIPNRSNRVKSMNIVPPSRLDFDRDLSLLSKIKHPTALKTIYKKLIKKYHPDQYPNHDYLNGWMAEINGQYQQNKVAQRSFA